MTNNKKLLIIPIILLLFTSVAAAEQVHNPYCRISYDSAMASNTIKYYKYNASEKAYIYDITHLVKFGDGRVLVGGSNTEITKNHNGSNPAWTTDGKFLVWIEKDNALYCREYNGSSNKKLADKVSSLGLNSESMVETVSYSDGRSEKISDLLRVSQPSPSAAPSATPTPTTTQKPVTTDTLKEWTDTAGVEHFEFGTHKVRVDGKNIYFGKYRISEMCEQNVRFVGIDSSYKVYLYEDSTASFYRFKPGNIFNPAKIKFSEVTHLEKVLIDEKTGYMTGVSTNKGDFTLEQFVTDKPWYPHKDYVINKRGYAQYYLAESNKVYTLKLKGSSLYLNGTLVAEGITRTTESFGFARDYIIYLKGKTVYRAKLTNPNAVKWNTHVLKLKYSTKDGTVCGFVR